MSNPNNLTITIQKEARVDGNNKIVLDLRASLLEEGLTPGRGLKIPNVHFTIRTALGKATAMSDENGLLTIEGLELTPPNQADSATPVEVTAEHNGNKFTQILQVDVSTQVAECLAAADRQKLARLGRPEENRKIKADIISAYKAILDGQYATPYFQTLTKYANSPDTYDAIVDLAIHNPAAVAQSVSIFKDCSWAQEAMEAVVSHDPQSAASVISDYYEKPWAYGVVKKAAESCPTNVIQALRDYHTQEWSQQLIESLAILNPKEILDNNEEWQFYPWAESVAVAAAKLEPELARDLYNQYKNRPWSKKVVEVINDLTIKIERVRHLCANIESVYDSITPEDWRIIFVYKDQPQILQLVRKIATLNPKSCIENVGIYKTASWAAEVFIRAASDYPGLALEAYPNYSDMHWMPSVIKTLANQHLNIVSSWADRNKQLPIYDSVIQVLDGERRRLAQEPKNFLPVLVERSEPEQISEPKSPRKKIYAMLAVTALAVVAVLAFNKKDSPQNDSQAVVSLDDLKLLQPLDKEVTQPTTTESKTKPKKVRHYRGRFDSATMEQKFGAFNQSSTLMAVQNSLKNSDNNLQVIESLNGATLFIKRAPKVKEPSLKKRQRKNYREPYQPSDQYIFRISAAGFSPEILAQLDAAEFSHKVTKAEEVVDGNKFYTFTFPESESSRVFYTLEPLIALGKHPNGAFKIKPFDKEYIDIEIKPDCVLDPRKVFSMFNGKSDVVRIRIDSFIMTDVIRFQNLEQRYAKAVADFTQVVGKKEINRLFGALTTIEEYEDFLRNFELLKQNYLDTKTMGVPFTQAHLRKLARLISSDARLYTGKNSVTAIVTETDQDGDKDQKSFRLSARGTMLIISGFRTRHKEEYYEAYDPWESTGDKFDAKETLETKFQGLSQDGKFEIKAKSDSRYSFSGGRLDSASSLFQFLLKNAAKSVNQGSIEAVGTDNLDLAYQTGKNQTAKCKIFVVSDSVFRVEVLEGDSTLGPDLVKQLSATIKAQLQKDLLKKL